METVEIIERLCETAQSMISEREHSIRSGGKGARFASSCCDVLFNGGGAVNSGMIGGEDMTEERRRKDILMEPLEKKDLCHKHTLTNSYLLDSSTTY